MASRKRSLGWRNRAAGELLLRHLPGLVPRGPVLVMEDPLESVAEGLGNLGLEVASWHRLALGGVPASPWPPAGPFRTVAIRIPRSKEALAMNLHAAAGVLEEGGTVLVYGAKDEGIASATRPMETLLDSVETVGVGGRCRILRGVLSGGGQPRRTTLEEWKKIWNPEHPDLPSRWVSYPGVFAHGQLDAGTRLLLDSLPEIPAGWSVLDYGCGSGILGAAILSRQPRATVHLLDVDVVALEAARENVPGATPVLSDGLAAVPSGSVEAIASNPPFHKGKDEDPSMLSSLIEASPRVLKPGGVLTLVSQRRIRLDGALEKAFRHVRILARDSAFAVWQGTEPRAPGH